MAEVMFWPKECALTTLNTIAGLFAWNDPELNKPEPESVVAVVEGYADYTEEELEKLAVFSNRVLLEYRYTCGESTVGANILRVTKDDSWGGDTVWWARKLTWEFSSYFDTVDELIESFRRGERYTL